MAKKNGKKSTDMVTPMFTDGTMNGPVTGPKRGTPPKDPLGYKSNTGYAAPGGSPSDRQASSTGERATAH